MKPKHRDEAKRDSALAEKSLKLLKDLAETSEALPDEDTDLGPIEFDKRWSDYHAALGRAKRFLSKRRAKKKTCN